MSYYSACTICFIKPCIQALLNIHPIFGIFKKISIASILAMFRQQDKDNGIIGYCYFRCGDMKWY